MLLIGADLQPRLYSNLAFQVTELGADVIALGGMPDHVHLLVRFPATISVAEFVARVKGASSYFVSNILTDGNRLNGREAMVLSRFRGAV